ncbi:hypothetical protein LRS73_31925 [Methylobacterium currus]|uniref:hypothetical protein n=1 Tax=Methylobacterium currus TaxID=2051553 RepID=UPI001E3FC8F9|nr:hypothetical protein [Methylobacterium currus]UHC19464.1 hypothetical protein LRS73_31925 [Methylobacterium currus]
MLSSLQRPWLLRLLSSRRQPMLVPAEEGSGVAASAPVAADLVARASEARVAASEVVLGSRRAASAVAEVRVASVALLAARGLLSVVNVELVPSQLVASVLPLAALTGAGTPAIEVATTADGATGTELPG